MRHIAPCLCAVALAFPAMAQPSTPNWKVDVARYGSVMPFKERIIIRPDYDPDYQTFHIGRTQFHPWVESREEMYFRSSIAEMPRNMRTVEVGFVGYSPDRPRLSFAGQYLYRQLPNDDRDNDEMSRNVVHGIKTPHEWGAKLGFVCQFPITTC